MSGPSGECYCGVCRICLESLLELEVAASLELHAEVATLRTQLATAEADRDAIEDVLAMCPGQVVAGMGEVLSRKGIENGVFGWWLTSGGFISLNNLVAHLRPEKRSRIARAALKPTPATCFIDGCQEPSPHRPATRRGDDDAMSTLIESDLTREELIAALVDAQCGEESLRDHLEAAAVLLNAPDIGRHCGYDHKSAKCPMTSPCWHHRRNSALKAAPMATSRINNGPVTK